MSSTGFRRTAIFVALFSLWIAGLGIANLMNHFIGGTVYTVIAFIGAACGLNGARLIFRIARRLKTERFANRNAKPSQ